MTEIVPEHSPTETNTLTGKAVLLSVFLPQLGARTVIRTPSLEDSELFAVSLYW